MDPKNGKLKNPPRKKKKNPKKHFKNINSSMVAQAQIPKKIGSSKELSPHPMTMDPDKEPAWAHAQDIRPVYGRPTERTAQHKRW